MCVIKSEVSVCRGTIVVSHNLASFFHVSSTILEEEKLQQKERNRMEMRRQVTVSWDSGGSDEAPPKVRCGYTSCVCVFGCLLVFVNVQQVNKTEPLVPVLFEGGHSNHCEFRSLFSWRFQPL